MIGFSRCATATVGCSALRQMCLVLTLLILCLTMHIITDTGIDEHFVFMSSVIFRERQLKVLAMARKHKKMSLRALPSANEKPPYFSGIPLCIMQMR
jgi:hypothetical protein